MIAPLKAAVAAVCAGCAVAAASPWIAAQSPAVVRVRITAAPVVELTGHARLEGSTATGSIVSIDEDTAIVRGDGGETVVLPRPGHRIVGVLASVDEHTVTISRGRASRVTIPRAAIDKLERHAGRRSRGRSALLGLLIGAGGGAGIGYMIGSSCQPSGFLGCFLEPWGSTFGGVLIGGVAGALIGALGPRADRWIPVTVDWLDRQ